MFQQDKPTRFMEELDAWAETEVIRPLIDSEGGDPNEDIEVTVARVKKAIREKVLESYHNGQQRPTGAGRPRR
jgi:hypothetical protein